MIANGASAIAITISYLSKGKITFSYYSQLFLNWFSFAVLTLTLIHIIDL